MYSRNYFLSISLLGLLTFDHAVETVAQCSRCCRVAFPAVAVILFAIPPICFLVRTNERKRGRERKRKQRGTQKDRVSKGARSTQRKGDRGREKRRSTKHSQCFSSSHSLPFPL